MNHAVDVGRHLLALAMFIMLTSLVMQCENDPFGSGCDGQER